MSPDWWAAFGPAQTTVSCGGGTHDVRWSDGSLHSLQHPDAEGELVLAALGGDATPCIDLIQIWGRRSDDLSVLAIGPRSGDDALTLTAAALDELLSASSGPGWASYTTATSGRRVFRSRRKPPRRAPGFSGSFSGGSVTSHGLVSGWTSPVPATRLGRASMLMMQGKADPARGELLSLLALGQPFQFRLSGTVAHAWSADGQHAGRRGHASPALTAALTGRLAPAVARWIDLEPGKVDAVIYDDAGWGEVELTREGGERRLRAALPVSWLASVWAAGMAVVGGHLVVSVEQATWPAAYVLAVSAPGRDPVELNIRHEGEGWMIDRGE